MNFQHIYAGNSLHQECLKLKVDVIFRNIIFSIFKKCWKFIASKMLWINSRHLTLVEPKCYFLTTPPRVGSCAIDFQTESVLALNKKLKINWNFQFFTFGLKVNCTWSSLNHSQCLCQVPWLPIYWFKS